MDIHYAIVSDKKVRHKSLGPAIDYVINNVNYPPGFKHSRFLETENSWHHSFKNDYRIEISELQTLKDFFKKAYSSEDKIKLSIERFSIACGRKSDYDKLSDLVIALELLLGHGSGDSISYKIIIRLLNLISSKEKIRRKLYSKMKKLYSARSAIVHGSDRQPAFDCINILEEYEYIIRTVISGFIETMQSKSWDYEQMINKLDHDIRGISEIDTSKISWNE